MTLLGLISVVFNVLTLLIYDPLYCTDSDGPNSPPQWIYFTCALLSLMMHDVPCAHPET